MNKRQVFGMVLLSCFIFVQGASSLFAQDVDAAQLQRLIAAFKTNDKAKIASCFAFPYSRDYPLASIADTSDFVAKFNEVLDDTLIKEVASSSVKADWSQVGWRGIMFKNGTLWLDDDYKICTVNYETAAGKKALESAIASDKATLPKAEQSYIRPVKKWNVNGSVYRVDLTAKDTYRFLIIGKKSKVAVKLDNGTITTEGSGGNCYYSWKDAKKNTHIVYLDVMGGSAFYSVLDASNTDMDTMSDHIVQTLE